MTEIQGWVIIGLYVGTLIWLLEGIYGKIGKFLCNRGWHNFGGGKRTFCQRSGCMATRDEG